MPVLRHLAACALLVAFIASAATAAERPNIVVFFADDHGFLDTPVYGRSDVRTPSMQRLARDGATFTHAFVASPSCAPSRGAMLTGLMPARNGAEANHTFPKQEIRTLPEYLGELGYQVAAFGKIAHGRRGATEARFPHIDPLHDPARVSRWLAARETDKPVCLLVGTHDPHVPWPNLGGYDPQALVPPTNHVDTPETRRLRAQYYADVTQADTELGEIYDLSREVLGENTLFLYTSDHGAQWPFGKWNLYDTGIRVPLLAVWPGVIEPGTKREAMVSWIDLLPTFIEIAGGSPPQDLDGRSFLPVLRGETDEHRQEIFTTHSGDGDKNIYPIRSLRTREFKYIHNLHPEFSHTTHIDIVQAENAGTYWPSWEAAAERDSAAREIVRQYHERPREELFDLEHDPLERHNLADRPEYAQQLEAMRAQVDAWMAAQGDEGTVFNEPRLLAEPKVAP